MIGYLAAMLAEFLQNQFLRRLHFIFGCDVIPVFANLTGKSDGYSMFSLFCHVSNYTQYTLKMEERWLAMLLNFRYKSAKLDEC